MGLLSLSNPLSIIFSKSEVYDIVFQNLALRRNKYVDRGYSNYSCARIVIILLLRAETSNTLCSELFLKPLRMLVAYFLSFFQKLNDFLSLLFVVAPPDEIYSVWRIVVEPFC